MRTLFVSRSKIALAAALVLAICSSGRSNATAASVVEHDPIPRIVDAIAPEKPRPAVTMRDYDWFRAPASASTSTVSGTLIAHTKLGWVGASDTHVYLLPASAYTKWYAYLATVNARRYVDRIAVLDRGVRDCCLRVADANEHGDFSFANVPPGSYYLFGALELDEGPFTPDEVVERGWDGAGHGADVIVPYFSFDKNAFERENFSYVYGYTFRAADAPWQLGRLPGIEHFVNGKQV